MRLRLLHPALAVLVALPATARAQLSVTGLRDTSPVAPFMPPAGMCRVWVNGVPANQQPAPTDCATALRQKPKNGVVIYGPTRRDGNADRFDPKVGTDPRPARTNTANDAAAESRARADEIRREREMQERRRLDSERARNDARNDPRNGRTTEPRSTASPTPPRTSGGGSSGSAGSSRTPSTGTPSASRPPASERPAKPPTEPTKKPE